MQLRVKKCIHLMVILLALVETFTGAIIDCVVCTIFYPASLEHEGSSDYYFTAQLLPTKHFYRLIIVLYVPILYLWRSHGVGGLAEESSSPHGRSTAVLRVICTRIPRRILPATTGWLWHWLRALQSSNAGVLLADNPDADCLRKPTCYENGKSWGASIHYGGQQHDSVIKQYNTRVCCIYFDCLLLCWICVALWSLCCKARAMFVLFVCLFVCWFILRQCVLVGHWLTGTVVK